MTERFGIEFPIFAFSHCRDVVAAVSRAGGMGVLGALAFTPDELEIELNWIDEHIGDHPYGVDIVIPNKYEGMNADMSAEELTKRWFELGFMPWRLGDHLFLAKYSIPKLGAWYELVKRLKKELDPNDILNPGKMIR